MCLAYSSFVFDIVLIDNKFRHMLVERLVQLRIGLGGRGNVDIVSRLYLPTNAPYVVDHRCNNFVESYVVHSLNLGQVELDCMGMDCYVLEFPKVMFLLFRWKIYFAINDKE